ncbi:MAG: hypothetical protein IKR04_05780 [Clostridia bacterium]|nr:hypothetical protein [Clostridia bacterium]
MELRKVESKEEIQELYKQCRFIDDALDTDVYALYDSDDPKTVFTLKRIGDSMQPISTIRQLDFETKPEAQGHGYATQGFEKMIVVITSRADISEVYIDAANPLSAKIAERFGIESAEAGRYVIKNPNFDINYEIVCNMIKSGVDEKEIRAFASSKGLSSSLIDKWIAIQKELPQIESQGDEIPIFTPPSPEQQSKTVLEESQITLAKLKSNIQANRGKTNEIGTPPFDFNK